MSDQLRTKIYQCPQGCDYGSCDKHNRIRKLYQGVSDSVMVYYTYHIENPESIEQEMLCMFDDEFMVFLGFVGKDLHDPKTIETEREEAEEISKQVNISAQSHERLKRYGVS